MQSDRPHRLVEVTRHYTDDSQADSSEVITAREAGQMFPHLSTIPEDPNFVSLSYSLGFYHVNIKAL